ncbi:MAG: DinB family protein [Candidatus Phosphoribacter sp.]
MTDTPAEPPPDDKDWTWVLDRPCPECGFGAVLEREDLPGRVRAAAAKWPAVLSRPDATTRPSALVWSPLEYGCHVRDVFRLFAERVTLMLERDDPRFANWDQDETAVAEHYRDQDPAVVAAQILQAGEALAGVFERVGSGEWERAGTRSNGSRFTIETLGRYCLHDVDHHAWDVGA